MDERSVAAGQRLESTEWPEPVVVRDYRALFDAIDEGFCIVEMVFDEANHPVDLRFCEVNHTFEAQTGLVGVVGQMARTVVPGLEDRWFQVYGEVALTRQPKRFAEASEVLHRWFDVYAFPMGPPSSKEVAIVFKDITTERLALLELRENDRLKDEFLAMLAHELRNPMVPIQAALYQLRQSPDEQAVRHAADAIDRQMGQLVRLVDDLMEVSRVTRGKVTLKSEPFELQYALHGAIEAVVPMLAKAGIKLTTALPDTPILVNGDAVRLTQVFTNLLNNAIKYSSAGHEVTLSLSPGAGGVEVTVADDGMGIPVDRLDHIFELFTQLGTRGTSMDAGLGIGLTLVRTLVEMHGGSVHAESEGPGKGSRFVVRLPCLQGSLPSRLAQEQEAGVRALAGLRVMVVDDNRDIADSFADWLHSQGAVVRTCQDGQSALEAATLWAPHVVMLDLGLPGPDGWEIARRLRADPEGLSRLLVAISCWGQPADVERSRRAGFDEHFTKPPALPRLQALLSEHRARVMPVAD